MQKAPIIFDDKKIFTIQKNLKAKKKKNLSDYCIRLN